MNNTLILYENNSNKEVKEMLNKIEAIIYNAKLHQITEEIKDIDLYSNILVAISAEDENHFNLYKSLREHNIDFTDRKLIIVCIGKAKQDAIKYIGEVQDITKKYDLYYYFININGNVCENVTNAAINIRQYIETPKKKAQKSY